MRTNHNRAPGSSGLPFDGTPDKNLQSLTEMFLKEGLKSAGGLSGGKDESTSVRHAF